MPPIYGAVAAGDPQTVEAGIHVLKQGGNAVDALVAAAYAALVAEPFLINIGGGGLATLYLPDKNRALTYDFMVDVPSRPPYPTMDFRRILVQFEAAIQHFHIGRASAGVPGLVAGLCRLHSDWGRLPLQQVMAPAIALAEQGATISQSQVHILNTLRDIFSADPQLRDLYFPHGQPITAGTRIARPDVAHTLKRIASEGPDVFYRGDLAQAIVRDQERRGGLITANDLAHYEVYILPALETTYRGWRVFLPPPPSRGGGLVALALALLSDHPISEWTFLGPRHAALHAAVQAYVQNIRPQWETVIERSPHPGEAWLAPANLTAHRKAFAQRWQERLAFSFPIEERATKPNTTHISVLDAEGLIVSMTMSAGEDAGFVVEDTGIQLNNMLGEDDLNPQGFHRWPPGTRLGTMMTPTIVRHDSGDVLVVGSGGSSRIRSAVVQVISAYLDFALPLDEAVRAPRIHYDEEGVVQLEGGIPEGTASALQHAGYRVNLWPVKSIYFGGAHAVARRGSITWEAAGDPRRGGAGAIV